MKFPKFSQALVHDNDEPHRVILFFSDNPTESYGIFTDLKVARYSIGDTEYEDLGYIHPLEIPGINADLYNTTGTIEVMLKNQISETTFTYIPDGLHWDIKRN